MRINVYSQELTEEVQSFEKVSDTGRKYYAVRLMLHSSQMLHHDGDDDDRSAVTFWLPRPDRAERFARTLELAAEHVRIMARQERLDEVCADAAKKLGAKVRVTVEDIVGGRQHPSEGVVKAGVDAARKVFEGSRTPMEGTTVDLVSEPYVEVEKRVMSHESDAAGYKGAPATGIHAKWSQKSGPLFVILKDEGKSDFRFVEVEDENGKSVACPWMLLGERGEDLYAIRIDLAPKPTQHPDEAQQMRDDEWFNRGRRHERDHIGAFIAALGGGNARIDTLPDSDKRLNADIPALINLYAGRAVETALHEAAKDAKSRSPQEWFANGVANGRAQVLFEIKHQRAGADLGEAMQAVVDDVKKPLEERIEGLRLERRRQAEIITRLSARSITLEKRLKEINGITVKD